MGLPPVDIYHFSGTGNTWRAVDRMRQTFEAKAVPVKLIPLQGADPVAIDLTHTIGIAFPVACQSTYPFVWDFLRAFPEANGTGVFMVDTLEAFSGGAVGPLRRLLEKKGYTPLGAREIAMPSNFLRRRLKPDKDDATIERGLQEADAFAAALIEGTAVWGGLPLLSPVFHFISTRPFLWSFMRWLIPLAVNQDKCNGCGLCASLCPVGNIAVNDKAVLGKNCQLCMRCSSFCPQGAINSPRWNFKPYRAATPDQLTATATSSSTGEPEDATPDTGR